MVNHSLCRTKRKVSIVPLTGGLGNQLFQYAFGLYLEVVTGNVTIFDQVIGRPRKIGEAISLVGVTPSSNAPRFLTENPNVLRGLYTKAFGWTLRTSLSMDRNSERATRTLRFLTRFMLQIRVRRCLKVVSSQDLGFDSSIKIDKSGMYIGYFQTFVYASTTNVSKVLQSLTPKTLSAEFSSLQREICEAKPILLHVRLTDYLKEGKFGIPSISYYQKSFDRLAQVNQFTKVWVFSDDVDGARRILKNFNREVDLHFFEQGNLSDLEVWELMKNFGGYIISNSSFAWWSAFLRKDPLAPVCAPEPWFQGMKDPTDLLPSDWIRVDPL